MATQTVEFRAVPSQTITAKLFTVGSDVEQASVSATEATNRKGTYSAAFTDEAAGEYELIAFVGSVPVARWFVTLTLTTATFQAYDKVGAVELDPASVTAVQTGLATSASITALRGADNDTLKTLSDQIDGISSGGTDWTANERTAIRSILGVPASGTTPADPTTGILDTIRDSVSTYISGIAASASLTQGTIVGFPATLAIGDSYTDDCDSAIQVFIRDENDDPITAVGTHEFTDADFAPECTITQNGNTGRVKCEVEYVEASPENYLKIQIPSKESRRATPGVATVQVLLKWDGAQKALSKQTVSWDGLI